MAYKTKEEIENNSIVNLANFDKQIRKKIQKENKTLADIQRDLNFSDGLVSGHCNHTKNISFESAVAYAHYFGVSLDYLIGDTTTEATNTEIRAICEYTGLSKQAVVCLHSKGQGLIPKEWTNLIYKTINPFIENLFVFSQENIINLLDEYEYHVNKANKIYNKSQGVFTLKDFEKKYDDWKNEKDLAELKHFQISNAFNKFFNNKLVTDEEQILSDMKTQMTNKLRELINNEYVTEGENGNDSEA